MDFLDIHRFLFGKYLGGLIYGLYVFYAFTLGAFVTRHYCEFIQITSMPETPQYALAICIMLVGIYITRNGIETLGRWCLFSLPIILFIFMITVILSFGLFNYDNLKPMFQSGFPLIAENAYNAYVLPFGESVVFLLLLDSIQDRAKTHKSLYIGMILGTAMIIMAIFRNILVLGVANNKLLVSPSVSAVSIIQLGSFAERIEVIVSIIFTICGLAKISICLMGSCRGIAKLLNLSSNRLLSAPLGLLMLMLSFNAFENIMHLNEWFSVYRILFMPIQVLLPLVTWITAEAKSRSGKHKDQ
jgi:spore germination protein KB